MLNFHQDYKLRIGLLLGPVYIYYSNLPVSLDAEARVISAQDISMQPCGNRCPLLLIMRAVLRGFEAATWAYFAQAYSDFAPYSSG